MTTSNTNSKKDFSIIFNEIERYKLEGLIAEIESISLDSSSNNEIRDFWEACKELGEVNNQTPVVYNTFS
jgi:hypothetical protein